MHYIRSPCKTIKKCLVNNNSALRMCYNDSVD